METRVREREGAQVREENRNEMERSGLRERERVRVRDGGSVRGPGWGARGGTAGWLWCQGAGDWVRPRAGQRYHI